RGRGRPRSCGARTRSSGQCGRRWFRSSPPFSAAHLGFARPARATGAGPLAAFGEELETERAGDRRRLDQAHRHRVAEPVARPAAVADERMATLFIAEILGADVARRDEAVGARVVELDEQAGAGDAGDVALERCPDALGQ